MGQTTWLDITDEDGEWVGVGTVGCQYAIYTDYDPHGPGNGKFFLSIKGPGIRLTKPNTLTLDQAKAVVQGVMAGIHHDAVTPDTEPLLTPKTVCLDCGDELQQGQQCDCDPDEVDDDFEDEDGFDFEV